MKLICLYSLIYCKSWQTGLGKHCRPSDWAVWSGSTLLAILSVSFGWMHYSIVKNTHCSSFRNRIRAATGQRSSPESCFANKTKMFFRATKKKTTTKNNNKKKQNKKTEAHGPQWLAWENSYKSLTQHFRRSVAMATNQNEEICIIFVSLVGEYSTNIKKNKFYQNTWNETAIKTNFYFTHNKSMERLMLWTFLKKFQLYHPYNFWGVDFLKYF